MFRLQSISKLALCLAGALAIFLPNAHAIDAGDMDPHLPDNVILATMRFRAFLRKADDKKEWN